MNFKGISNGISKSLIAKLLVFVLAILFLSLVTVSTVFGILGIHSTEDTAKAILTETSRTAALAVQNKIEATENIIKEIGTTASLSNEEVSVEEKRQILASKSEEYKIESISVTDTLGYDLDGNFVGDKNYFTKAIAGETFISTTEKTSDGAGTIIYISAPLWDKGVFGTNVVGIVYATINATYLSNISDTIHIGNTGKAYIVDRNTVFIAHSDKSKVKNQASIKAEASSDNTLEPLLKLAEQAIQGKSSYGEYTYNGEKKIAMFAQISETDRWVICVNVYKSEIMKKYYKTLVICIIISVVCLILAAGISILISRKLLKPIKEVEEAARHLSEGNFDYKIEYIGQDELGRLAESMRAMIDRTKAVIEDTKYGLKEMAKGNFDIQPSVEHMGIFKEIENAMLHIIENLSETLLHIKNSSIQVDVGAEQISIGSQALAEGSMEQSSSIEHLTELISEISKKIRETAEYTNVANQKTLNVGDELQLSKDEMNQMMIAMEEITDKSKQISKIIKSIEDIAFQTNILALNAAVEAARAGAAGKGFAVVADEVRNLAQKSAEAANDTTNLIEETVKAVSKGSAIAKKTSYSITEVVEHAGDVIDAINEISVVFKEQAQSVHEIKQRLDEVSAVVQSNSASAEESAAASEELSAQASTLQAEVSKFIIKEY